MRSHWLVIALVLALALALLWSDPASATPCEHHRGAAKVACVKAHNAQVKRDRIPWPSNPTMADLRKRLTATEISNLLWICVREQPRPGKRFGCWWDAPYTKYVGGLGMFRQTYGIGANVTHYPYPPKASAEEQLAVGVIVMRQYGPSAWDSWGSR